MSTQFSQSSHPAIQAMHRKMTISQTYYLAHTARSKLSSEAARSDHNLRLLVGHANLLDVLTLELQDAERAQEALYNKAMPASPKKDNHTAWNVTIVEESEDLSDYEVDEVDSDDDDDFVEDTAELIDLARPLAHINSSVNFMLPAAIDDDDEDESEDMESLYLTRVRSHSSQLPELVIDNSDDSDDDSTISPPPASPNDMSDQGIIAMDFGYNYNMKSKPSQERSLCEDDYYLPQQNSSPMIAAC